MSYFVRIVTTVAECETCVTLNYSFNNDKALYFRSDKIHLKLTLIHESMIQVLFTLSSSYLKSQLHLVHVINITYTCLTELKLILVMLLVHLIRQRCFL